MEFHCRGFSLEMLQIFPIFYNPSLYDFSYFTLNKLQCFYKSPWYTVVKFLHFLWYVLSGIDKHYNNLPDNHKMTLHYAML